MFKYERRQLTPQDTQRGPFCDRWTGVGGHSQGGYRNTERCCPPKLFRLSLPGPFSAKSVTYCFPWWLFKECTRYRVKILVRTLFLVQSLHHDLQPHGPHGRGRQRRGWLRPGWGSPENAGLLWGFAERCCVILLSLQVFGED